MLYLPYEGWSDARLHLYNRTLEIAKKIGSMNQVELMMNQKVIIKHLKEIANCIKDFCFVVDEVANFTEKEFPREKKRLIKYIQEIQKNPPQI